MPRAVIHLKLKGILNTNQITCQCVAKSWQSYTRGCCEHLDSPCVHFRRPRVHQPSAAGPARDDVEHEPAAVSQPTCEPRVSEAPRTVASQRLVRGDRCPASHLRYRLAVGVARVILDKLSSCHHQDPPVRRCVQRAGKRSVGRNVRRKVMYTGCISASSS